MSSEKRSWQARARELARQAEEELKSDRVRKHIDEARAAASQAFDSDEAKRIRAEAEVLGAKARAEVEKALKREDVQRVREGAADLGARAIHAVEVAAQRPEVEGLRHRAESVIDHVSERIRSATASGADEEPEDSDTDEPGEPTAA